MRRHNKQAKKNYKPREINGIVNVDKPIGLSSNQVLQKIKSLYRAKKAGHTGNLDPLATGVLPICLGHATKLSQFLLDSDKSYLAGIVLGISTTTGDREGDIIEPIDRALNLSRKQIETCLSSLVGEQEQIPPMHSALKKDGQPLYKLARKGITVERKARKITIYQLTLESYNFPEIIVHVSCSKGTYIRTLAEDIGHYFNTGAHLSSLRRTKAGPFSLDESTSLDELQQISIENKKRVLSTSEDNNLKNENILQHCSEDSLPVEQANQLDQKILAMDRILYDYPEIILTEVEEIDIRFGRKIKLNKHSPQCSQLDVEKLFLNKQSLRLYSSTKLFLGLGIIQSSISEDIQTFYLQPKRMFC